MAIGSLKEQEASVPTIGDVEVIHPRRGLLQIVRPRERATKLLVAGLVCVLLVSAAMLGVLWLAQREPSPETRVRLVLLTVLGEAYLLLGSFPDLLRNARIAVRGEVLTVTGDTGTIGRNGKFLARFDDVSHVEVRNTTRMKSGADDTVSMVEVNQLSIILKKYKRLRICDVWEWEEGRADQIDLAKELARILGVGLTFPAYAE